MTEHAIPNLKKIEGSSQISAIGHKGSRLFIRFHGGGLYSYADVPQHLYHEAVESPSIGSWFHKTIKGRFPHIKHDA